MLEEAVIVLDLGGQLPCQYVQLLRVIILNIISCMLVTPPISLSNRKRLKARTTRHKLSVVVVGAPGLLLLIALILTCARARGSPDEAILASADTSLLRTLKNSRDTCGYYVAPPARD